MGDNVRKIELNDSSKYSEEKPFEIDVKDHYEKFKVWVNDKSRLSEFSDRTMVGNYAIIEVFRVGLDEAKETTHKYIQEKTGRTETARLSYSEYIYPFAKILCVNEFTEGDFRGIKPGDIYVLPDSVANYVPTNEYLNSLSKEASNEKLVKTSNIHAMQLGLSSLMGRDIYITNKFAEGLRPSDKVTFRAFLSPDFFQNKYIPQ